MIKRAPGQSLVELALVAPILILLAMAAWDGGSVLREQVVLQQAARDGARIAATGYGSAVLDTTVSDAILASAADLPALRNTPGYMTISRPDLQSVRVQLKYAHALITPILRQVWGGGQGTLTLQASATFYQPQLTAVPATLVPTPTPTLTPTSILPTATPTVTPTLPPLRPACNLAGAAQPIPSLTNNQGYWCTVAASGSTWIIANWQDNNDPDNQLLVYRNIPAQFTSDPYTGLPSGAIGAYYNAGGSLWGGTTSCQPTGTYTIYFYNSGSTFPASTGAVWLFPCG